MQGTRRPGEARQRLLDAALRLYARNGVGGTSLQMIADELGVTKAAVYHQFPTKEEIAIAVISPALDGLALVADAAEAQRTRTARRETALTGVVDLMVTNRRLAYVLYGDPAMSALLRRHPALGAQAERLKTVLFGPDPDTETRLTATLLAGGMAAVGGDRHLADLGDGELRTHLLTVARRLLRARSS